MRTQTSRLVEYLRDHPRATSLEVTQRLAIVNVTGRVSDARAQGIDIVCERRPDGRLGYRLVRPVTTGVAVEMGL